MPGFWLKRQILMNLPSEDLEVSVANSIDFMVERVSATFSPHLVFGYSSCNLDLPEYSFIYSSTL